MQNKHDAVFIAKVDAGGYQSRPNGMKASPMGSPRPHRLHHMSARARGAPSHSMQVTRVVPGKLVPSLMRRRRVMADRITSNEVLASWVGGTPVSPEAN
jgi:hypothetical protein